MDADLPNKEKILNRLRKAQNLAERATNEGEAAAAAAAVQRILQEYQLEPDDIPENEAPKGPEMTQVFIPFAYKDIFISMLSFSVATHNFVYPIWTRVRDPRTNDIVDAIRFVGRKQNVETVILLFNNLLSRFNVITNQEFEDYKRKGGMIHGKKWKNSFKYGVIDGLNQKFDAQSEQFKQTSTAIVVRNDGEIKDYLALLGKKVPKDITKGTTAHNNNLDGNAFHKGEERGRNIDFQNHVGSQDRVRIA